MPGVLHPDALRCRMLEEGGHGRQARGSSALGAPEADVLHGPLALVVLWFVIDVLTGGDDWWFYWPTLGAGIAVAIVGIAMLGVGGLFGGDWERRQIERYLEDHGGPENETTDQS